MKLPLTFLAIALIVAGCGSGVEPGPLTGTWGGESVSLSAASSGTVITIGCGASIRLSYPVVLDGAGRFTIVDTLRGSIAGGAPKDTISAIQAVEVDGQISGDVLSLTFKLHETSGSVTLPFTVTAKRDETGDFPVCRD